MKPSSRAFLYIAVFVTAAVTSGFGFALLSESPGSSVRTFLIQWGKGACLYGWAAGLAVTLVFSYVWRNQLRGNKRENRDPI